MQAEKKKKAKKLKQLLLLHVWMQDKALLWDSKALTCVQTHGLLNI